MQTQPATDLNSPFLPEFGGPGGLSVTDPVQDKEHNIYKAKNRERRNDSSGASKDFLFILFRDNGNYSDELSLIFFSHLTALI